MSKRSKTKRSIAVRLRQLYLDNTGSIYKPFRITQGYVSKEEMKALDELTQGLCSEKGNQKLTPLLTSLCGTPDHISKMWSEFRFKPRQRKTNRFGPFEVSHLLAHVQSNQLHMSFCTPGAYVVLIEIYDPVL